MRFAACRSAQAARIVPNFMYQRALCRSFYVCQENGGSCGTAKNDSPRKQNAPSKPGRTFLRESVYHLKN